MVSRRISSGGAIPIVVRLPNGQRKDTTACTQAEIQRAMPSTLPIIAFGIPPDARSKHLGDHGRPHRLPRPAAQRDQDPRTQLSGSPSASRVGFLAGVGLEAAPAIALQKGRLSL